MRGRLVVILGPTAVGKSRAALAICERRRAEIVSADSMQVYRCMDIGTAKPGPAELARIPHHLVNVADPDERFSVADYQRLAVRAITEIHGRGSLPVVVGGTGLYIRALLRGYRFAPMEWDPGLRRRLMDDASRLGAGELYRRLEAVDPRAAARIHPNDMRRTVRALEVHELKGRPLTELEGASAPGYDALVIGISEPRPALYARIDARVDEMMDRGLLDEVKRLLEMGYGEELPSMQSLGYREMIQVLKGRTSREDGVRLLKRNTRRFAKRQLTWFRRDPAIMWVRAGTRVVEEIEGIIAGNWQSLEN